MRYRDLERIDIKAISASVRTWAADHPDGTAEQAVTDLDLPYPNDMVFIVRGILATPAVERPGG